MGKIKGQLEYEKFKKNKPLTRKEAILVQCYICNGEEESAEDCQNVSCPLYQYQPYKGKIRRESGSFMASQDKRMADVRALVS